MNILHISLTPFKNETRVLKQALFADRSDGFRGVHIVALDDGTTKQHETIGSGIEIVRKRLSSRNLPKMYIFQIFKYLEFVMFLLGFVRQKQIRLVTIHCLPLLPIALVLKMRHRVKVIYDAHELETEIHNISAFKRRIYKVIERWMIGWVDHTFVVSPSIMRWYENEYALGDRISMVLNTHERQGPVGDPRLHASLGISKDVRIILYQGALIKGRGIERMIAAFEGMDTSGYAMVFMGYGSLEGFIKEKAAAGGGIHFHQAVRSEEIAEHTRSAYCGVCYVENGSLNDHYCLPNKFFEYLYSGVPVIASNGPDMAQILDQYKVGMVLNDLDPSSLEKALSGVETMLDGGFASRIKAVNEMYSWHMQEQNLERVYSALLPA